MATPVILIPREPTQLKAAHEFHLERVGEFLLPREIGQFDKLAAAGELWVALDGSRVVATCYVTREDGADDAEFGGIIFLARDLSAGALRNARTRFGHPSLSGSVPLVSQSLRGETADVHKTKVWLTFRA